MRKWVRPVLVSFMFLGCTAGNASSPHVDPPTPLPKEILPIVEKVPVKLKVGIGYDFCYVSPMNTACGRDIPQTQEIKIELEPKNGRWSQKLPEVSPDAFVEVYVEKNYDSPGFEL